MADMPTTDAQITRRVEIDQLDSELVALTLENEAASWEAEGRTGIARVLSSLSKAISSDKHYLAILESGSEIIEADYVKGNKDLGYNTIAMVTADEGIALQQKRAGQAVFVVGIGAEQLQRLLTAVGVDSGQPDAVEKFISAVELQAKLRAANTAEAAKA